MKFSRLLDAARRHGASDIHVVSSSPPAFRVDGEIILADLPPLGPTEIETLVNSIITQSQRDILERERELCFSLIDESQQRCRVSIYYSGGRVELAVRVCQEDIGSLDQLHLPPFVDTIPWLTSGLALVTGPTGMGKTTTMNFIIDRINSQRRAKIVTIEDPVEFTHHHKRSLVIQQEVHTDTLSFGRALIHALRQDPDVIAIGEMRDLETMRTALTAAETGHLVLATLHTPDATQTIERIISVFPAYQQEQVRYQCANTLKAVVAQKLLPRAGGPGRVLACEILNVNTAARSIIREGATHKLYSVLQTGLNQSMNTMDAALLDLYLKGDITYDTALNNATHPSFIEHRTSTGKSTPA